MGCKKKNLIYDVSLNDTLKQKDCKINGVWMFRVELIRDKVIKKFIYIACGETKGAAGNEDKDKTKDKSKSKSKSNRKDKSKSKKSFKRSRVMRRSVDRDGKDDISLGLLFLF